VWVRRRHTHRSEGSLDVYLSHPGLPPASCRAEHSNRPRAWSGPRNGPRRPRMSRCGGRRMPARTRRKAPGRRRRRRGGAGAVAPPDPISEAAPLAAPLGELRPYRCGRLRCRPLDITCPVYARPQGPPPAAEANGRPDGGGSDPPAGMGGPPVAIDNPPTGSFGLFSESTTPEQNLTRKVCGVRNLP